jgi:hypothetical protein
MPAYSLGGIAFPSKKTAVEKIRDILRTSPLDVPLADADYFLIRAMLELHPNKDKKLAGGGVAIVVGINGGPGSLDRTMPSSRGFQVVQANGSKVDFSYRIALGLDSPEPNIAKAARRAVTPAIVAYKTARFRGATHIPCDETGQMIAFGDAHVDHSEPWTFKRILDAFIAKHGE